MSRLGCLSRQLQKTFCWWTTKELSIFELKAYAIAWERLNVERPQSAYSSKAAFQQFVLSLFYLFLGPGTSSVSPRKWRCNFHSRPKTVEREDNVREKMIYARRLKQFQTLSLRLSRAGFFKKSNLPCLCFQRNIDNLDERRLCKSNYAVERSRDVSEWFNAIAQKVRV